MNSGRKLLWPEKSEDVCPVVPEMKNAAGEWLSVLCVKMWMTLGQCRLFWKGVNFIVVQSHKEWARLVKGQRIKEELFHKMHLT